MIPIKLLANFSVLLLTQLEHIRRVESFTKIVKGQLMIELETNLSLKIELLSVTRKLMKMSGIIKNMNNELFNKMKTIGLNLNCN